MSQTLFNQFRRKALQLLAIAPIALLTACGGGGSGGDTLTGGGPEGKITINASPSKLPSQSGTYIEPGKPGSAIYTSNITANVTLANGSVASIGGVDFIIEGGSLLHGGLYDATVPGLASPSDFALINGGQAHTTFYASSSPGTVTIRASWADPSSKKTLVASTQIVVGSAISTGLPSSLTATLANAPVYVANQGLNDTGVIDIFVGDPVGEPVGAPPAPNVKVELLNPEIGATLLGVGGAAGSIVNTTTINGKAQISLRSGTTAGVAKLRFTADAADNNVENGIQSPVIDDLTFSIEDGRIASLAFTGAFSQAITANKVTIPLAPGESFLNGTYLRVVSAIAIDNLGNPVKNARIDFSLIDSPIVNYPAQGGAPVVGVGDFVIGGDKGDPSEGGNLFIANDSLAGARINDRLVIGANKQGAVSNFEQGSNRDLIGSRIISSLLDSNRLLVTEPFSANGGSNAGATIPWIIGRAQYGVIGASATTDDQGVATTFLTYPATRLNQKAILTARAGNSRSILMEAYYAGIQENSTLTTSTTSVYGGKKTPVTMCAYDGIQTPMGNTAIKVSGLAGGVVLDPATPVTGSNGCVTFNIDATKYLGSETLKLVFTINGQGVPSATIEVKPEAIGDLIVGVGGPGAGSREITVTLYNTLGEPMPNRQVTVTGKATDDGAPPNSTPPGVIAVFNDVTPSSLKTDSEGKVTFTASYVGNPPASLSDGAVPPTYTLYDGDTYTLTVKVVGTSGTADVTFPY